MDVWVQADETQLAMTFVNSFGAGMGDLVFTKAGISFSSPYFPASFASEYIVADFQFCFYRAERLARVLAELGLTFTAERRSLPDGGEAEVRVISDGKKRVAEIEKTKTEIHYTNHLRAYSYTILGEFP
jgi:hypothetical protein